MARRHLAARVTALALLLTMLLSAFACALVWPEASGGKTGKKGSLTVDYSHASDGYIMARAGKSNKKLKLRITRGDTTYTYDLNGGGTWEVFPLQMGDGSYTVQLYKNASGKKYAKDGEMTIKVALDDPNAPFLCPSQYVNYTADSPAVQQAAELCEGLTTDRQKLTAVQDYMKRCFVYDFVRAVTTKGTYLGDVDGTFQKRMGLCLDLSCVAAAMLRSQGIPTQVVVGYADKGYHAWNLVLVDGSYEMLDITALLNGVRKNVVYTADRYY